MTKPRRLSQSSREDLPGLEVGALESADGDVGVRDLGGDVERLGEVGLGVVVAVDEADVLALGGGDAVPAALPNAFVLLVDDDDL